MKTIYKALYLSLLLQVATANSATPESEHDFFTFTFENDVFVGEDDGYTNGMGLTFGESGFDQFDTSNVPSWIHGLIKDSYINTKPNKSRAVAHMFFHRMQTPTDIGVRELIPDDLPYAGLIAWQGTAYAWDAEASDQLSLTLGWVGPLAFGKQGQKAIHKIIGSDDPMGWDNQLDNEPVVKVEVQRLWNLYRNDNNRFQFDVIGLGGFGLGNLETATKGGVALRIGTNLSDSFGAFSLQADRHVNPLAFTTSDDFYAFVGARAGYVAHDILIDGNWVADSHSLPLEHGQDELAAGLSWSRNRIACVFTIASSSPKTELSNERESYGAFSITYRLGVGS